MLRHALYIMLMSTIPPAHIIALFIIARPDIEWIPALDTDTSTLYRNIGSYLHNDPTVEALRDRFKRARDEGYNHEAIKPFFVVDAPSGSGKTQLPFALSDASLKVLHVVMVDLYHPLIQLIYDNLKPQSKAFQKALKYDLEKIIATNANFGSYAKKEVASMLLYYNVNRIKYPLLSVQFLFAAIGEPRPFEQCTVAELRNAVTNKPSKVDVPVICIDEAQSKEHAQLTMLARNLLRAAGLVAVLMGTNASAANVLPSAPTWSGSRSGPPILWCRLITKLPPFHDNAKPLIGLDTALERLRGAHTSFCKMVEAHCHTINPYLLCVFAKKVNEWNAIPHDTADMVNELFANMTRTIMGTKCLITRSVDGFHAQIALLLGKSNIKANTSLYYKANVLQTMLRDRPAGLVAAHLARLQDDDCDLYLSNNKLNKKERNSIVRWKAQAYFVPPTQDPFLYLMFRGQFIWEWSDHMPVRPLRTCAALLAWQRETQRAAGRKRVTTNIHTISRCRDVLEACAVLSFVKASRYAGVQGTMLDAFLVQYTNELLPHSDAIRGWDGFPTLRERLNIRIPFLCSINEEWPASLTALPGCCMGSIANTNGTIYSVTQCNATLECKSATSAASGGATLEDCLQRATSGNVHFLIFASSAPSDCVTANDWKAFQRKHKLSKANVVKLSVSATGLLTFQPLDDMPWIGWSQCEKLFIVIAVEELAESAKIIALKQQPSSSSRSASASRKRQLPDEEEASEQCASVSSLKRTLRPRK